MRLLSPCRPASYTLMALGGGTALPLVPLLLLLVKAAAPLLVLAPARLPRAGLPALLLLELLEPAEQ